ncbi:hypothetical protein O4J56_19525 [Nocardiopsis sp. RSe5-2]|uniref:Uncharacterized protein n=1 Tax=Nocardiopsis endophytica TaxID=3018445 RepID=A0ABT4U7C1_9ACTN|nr:hypothetical protein [Nocardiopsis endophytica]MDA2812845.1 hypothetical protein [Nocardiopsis endophytica]
MPMKAGLTTYAVLTCALFGVLGVWLYSFPSDERPGGPAVERHLGEV